jgi:S1-C subfamily serine protease
VENFSEDSFLNIIEKVSQSTVHINTQQTRDYYRRTIPVRGIGSGFVIDDDSFIVTNYHVIQKANKIGIILGKEILKGSIKGSCRRLDIALIEVEGLNLPKLELGDSNKLRVGQTVYAIGNPLGLEGGPTVTSGVISALDRTIQDKIFLQGLIQTDAAINPGNSGGPLIDLRGKAVGVNTAIIPYAQGIGFAIPINSVKDCVGQLKSYGYYTTPWIGVEGLNLNPQVSRYYNFSVSEGVLISRVVRNSPANRAGIQRGDILVRFGNQAITDLKDLLIEIRKRKPGDVVSVNIVRHRKKITLNLDIEGTN